MDKIDTSIENPELTYKAIDGKVSDRIVQAESFEIAEGYMLEEQLRYQLLEHKDAPAFRFCVPDPTIIELNGKEYLVLTVLKETKNPSLCFFAIT